MKSHLNCTTGKFITIEGVEGAGKSTALTFIKNFLVEKNITVITTREPGGTSLAEDLRHLLLHAKHKESIQISTELLLMFAGRTQHIHQLIKPALEKGIWVISDRYIDASYAYQGGGRGLNQAFIQALDHWIVGDCYPQLTLLLNISVEVGLQRAEKRGDKDRIEQEDKHFFTRVRKTYLDRASSDPARIKIIDANQSLLLVQKQLSERLTDFIFQEGS